jgi:hypothetical protein
LVAGAIAAVNPLFIRQAHLVQVDTPLMLCSLVGMLFIWKLYTEPRSKWYNYAGVAIGLAASAKYTGALLFPALVCVHLLRERTFARALRSLQDPRLYMAGMLAAATFLLLNPYVLLSYGEFHEGFAFEQQHVATGHLGVDATQSTPAYYLAEALPLAFGWGFYVVIIGTVVWFLRRKQRSDLVLLAYPVVYLLVVSGWEMRVDRYILPIVPLLILVGAMGLMALWERFKVIISARDALSGTPWRLAGILLIGACVLLEPTVRSYRYLKPLGLPDTRAIGREWIRTHLPAGAVIASGPYGIDFAQEEYFTIHIPFLGFETERVAPFYDARWYEDVDLLITSDYDYGRFANEPQRYGEFLAYYESLRSRWRPVLTLGPSEERTGPTFWFYTYPDSLKKERLDPAVFGRIEAAPESARVSNFLKELNTAFLRKGQFQKSRQVLEEILAVEVENLPLRNMLAQILVNMGSYDAALVQLQRSAEMNPNQAEVFALAGHALLALRKYREAEPTLNKAIALNNRIEPAYVDLIALYTAEGKRNDLEAMLKQYLRTFPATTPRAKEFQARLDKMHR